MEEHSESSNEGPKRDGEYKPRCRRWLLFLFVYFVVVIDVGLIYSINKLFGDIRQMFGSTRAETATIHSTLLGFGPATGIFYGMVISRLGPRMTALIASSILALGMAVSFFATSITFLVVSIGIVTAASSVCAFIASSYMVDQHFRDSSAPLAMSILATGPGAGGMIYPYLIEYLYEYGLRGTFLLLAGLSMQTIPAAALWMQSEVSERSPVRVKGINNLVIFTVESQHEIQNCNVGETAIHIRNKGNTQPEDLPVKQHVIDEVKVNPHRRYSVLNIKSDYTKPKGRRASVCSMLTNKEFVAFIMSTALTNAPLSAFYVVFSDFVSGRGLTQANVTLGLLLINICSIFGRLGTGLLMQSQSIPVFMPVILSAMLGLLVMSLINFVNTLTVLLVLCSVFGIAFGLLWSALAVTTQAIVGANELAYALGFVVSVNGIGNAVAGPVFGLIRDQSGSYMAAVLSSTGPLLVATLLMILAQRCHRTRQQVLRSVSSISYITKL